MPDPCDSWTLDPVGVAGRCSLAFGAVWPADRSGKILSQFVITAAPRTPIKPMMAMPTSVLWLFLINPDSEGKSSSLASLVWLTYTSLSSNGASLFTPILRPALRHVNILGECLTPRWAHGFQRPHRRWPDRLCAPRGPLDSRRFSMQRRK